MSSAVDASAIRSLTGDGPVVDDLALEGAYAPPDSRWVRANLVVSLDGAVEVEGRAAGLGGPADRRLFATLRALADVIVVGANTAKIEHYGPARLSDQAVIRRTDRGQRPVPPIAVLSDRADLDPDARLFSDRRRPGGPQPLVCTCEAAPARARQALAERAEVVICGGERVDLDVALRQLRDRDLEHVLCEGGPTVLSNLLRRGLVDELCLTHSPRLAGPGHARLAAGDIWPTSMGAHLTHVMEGGGMLFGRYRIDRDEAGDG